MKWVGKPISPGNIPKSADTNLLYYGVIELDPVFHIDPTLDVPLYQQLVDMIQTAIKKGQLTSGQKLPTVQEMSQSLSIARGTIKRAYDELERKGMLEKVQGRGTFVCYQPADSGSRKEQAMAAIDAMLNQLEEMGLSAAEINIFLNLKIRERAEQDAKVKVVVVECSPENLEQMVEQLRSIEGVDLYSYLLDSVRQYPYKLGEDFDLLVTTASHVEYLQGILPGKKKISRAALHLSTDCLTELIRLPAGVRVGILGYSDRFCQLLQEACKCYAQTVKLHEPLVYAPEMDLKGYLENLDVLLVPKVYERYFGFGEAELQKWFSGRLLPCWYEMDEGSMLYLEAKIRRLLDAKAL